MSAIRRPPENVMIKMIDVNQGMHSKADVTKPKRLGYTALRANRSRRGKSACRSHYLRYFNSHSRAAASCPASKTLNCV